MEVNLSFHGGAGTVTGSRYLLSTGERRLLIDAGLFQGLKKLRLLNWQEPNFEPSSVDHLLLTHAHIDHSGYLPRLVRNGYSGLIYCTPATLDLAKLLLMDAAKIQEEDAKYANKKGFSKHRPALPLYTSEDARAAIEQMRAVPYGEWLELGDGAKGPFPQCRPHTRLGHDRAAPIVGHRGDKAGFQWRCRTLRGPAPLRSDGATGL